MTSQTMKNDSRKMTPHYELFTQDLQPLIQQLIQDPILLAKPGSKFSLSFKKNRPWEGEEEISEKIVVSVSKLLAALYHDKILLSLLPGYHNKKLASIIEKLGHILKNYLNPGVPGSGECIQLLKEYFHEVASLSSLIPLFNKDEFPLNAFEDYLLKDELISHVLSTYLVHFATENPNSLSPSLALPLIYERGIPPHIKQLLGQVFTPIPVADFLCRKLISEKITRIIDPACGTGILLLRALDLQKQKGFISSGITVIGIEKDPVLAMIAESAVNYFLKVNSLSIDFKIICADFFDCTPKFLDFKENDDEKTVFLVNPPYTRQELLKNDYKEHIWKRMIVDHEHLQIPLSKQTLPGRAGIYVYFIIHITIFLRKGDKLGLIVPNSWLDVRYGVGLKTCILTHYCIEFLLNSRLEKLIPGVEVNTTLMSLSRVDGKTEDLDHTVKFLSIDTKEDLEDFHQAAVSRMEITLVDREELASAPKWSIFFRQLQAYRELLQKAKRNLVSLRDIAVVRRGFTSGANNFFYLPKPESTNTFFHATMDPTTGDLILRLKDNFVREQFQAQGFRVKEPMFVIEKEYWMHLTEDGFGIFDSEFRYLGENGEKWIPNFLIKSPRRIRTYEVRESDVNHVVLLIKPASIKRMKNGVRRYIYWGEVWQPSSGKKYPNRPTCKSRRNWFELPLIERSQFKFICLMTINDRFPFFHNPRGFLCDARFNGVRFNDECPPSLLPVFLFILNSTFSAIQIELLGRSNLGEGGLDVKVYEYGLLQVPNLEVVRAFGQTHAYSDLTKMIHLFHDSSTFNMISDVQEPMLSAIDGIMAELFRANKETMFQIHRELQRIVSARIEKAREKIHQHN